VIEVVAKHLAHVTLRLTVGRLGVGLDNWAINELAEDPGPLRDRFLRMLPKGADVLFSEVNAAEIVGATGTSRESVRRFLTAVGPYWIPIEGTNFLKVIEREAAGNGHESCIASGLLKKFRAGRSILLCGEQRNDVVGPEFFDLAHFLDWLVPERDYIRSVLAGSDSKLGGTFKQLRVAYQKNRKQFDLLLPEPKYSPDAPVTFCYNALLRRLTVTGDAYIWKPGDSADFCHAIMTASYAQFATLDKKWKGRIENLPKPNGLAKIYFAPELGRFVADIEAALDAAPHVRTPMVVTDYGADV
jgi:hypothetical protein